LNNKNKTQEEINLPEFFRVLRVIFRVTALPSEKSKKPAQSRWAMSPLFHAPFFRRTGGLQSAAADKSLLIGVGF